MKASTATEVQGVAGVRNHLYHPVALDKALKRLSEVEHRSESEVVRKALRYFLSARELSLEGNPLLMTVGLVGKHGPGTGFVHHDDVYDHVN